MIDLKRCTRCEELKTPEHFSGKSTWCKSCHAVYYQEKGKFSPAAVAARRRWDKKNRDRMKEHIKKVRLTKEGKQQYLVTSKKSFSKRNNLEYDLTVGGLEWPDICPVFGIELNYGADIMARENSPSIDRLDSTKGYTNSNCRVISFKANQIKSNGTAEEHRKIAEYMEANL